jgi:hypothetical protein
MMMPQPVVIEPDESELVEVEGRQVAVLTFRRVEVQPEDEPGEREPDPA